MFEYESFACEIQIDEIAEFTHWCEMMEEDYGQEENPQI